MSVGSASLNALTCGYRRFPAGLHPADLSPSHVARCRAASRCSHRGDRLNRIVRAQHPAAGHSVPKVQTVGLCGRLAGYDLDLRCGTGSRHDCVGVTSVYDLHIHDLSGFRFVPVGISADHRQSRHHRTPQQSHRPRSRKRACRCHRLECRLRLPGSAVPWARNNFHLSKTFSHGFVEISRSTAVTGLSPARSKASRIAVIFTESETLGSLAIPSNSRAILSAAFCKLIAPPELIVLLRRRDIGRPSRQRDSRSYTVRRFCDGGATMFWYFRFRPIAFSCRRVTSFSPTSDRLCLR